jgi:hypothetical protein
LRRPGTVDRLTDQPARRLGLHPVADLNPFAGFQILVVFEKMLNLQQRYIRQINLVVNIVVAPSQVS